MAFVQTNICPPMSSFPKEFCNIEEFDRNAVNIGRFYSILQLRIYFPMKNVHIITGKIVQDADDQIIGNCSCLVSVFVLYGSGSGS